VRTLEDFLTHFRRQRAWTRRLVAAVPEEHFGWRPAEDSFSLGELVRHLIQSESFWRKMLTEGAAGRAFDPFGLTGASAERMAAFRRPNVESSRSAEKWGSTFAECLERWSEVQARTERELAAITPEQLREVEVDHPLLGLRLSLWEMLLTFVDHEVHHRGQLSAYLKVLGVDQPASLA
jgi:uncharacterized damage-inducible protein DinB